MPLIAQSRDPRGVRKPRCHEVINIAVGMAGPASLPIISILTPRGFHNGECAGKTMLMNDGRCIAMLKRIGRGPRTSKAGDEAEKDRQPQ